tara:strand:- start:305 stop:526 length:222 start_codon:yes stop_codon:yes gene_type:complete
MKNITATIELELTDRAKIESLELSLERVVNAWAEENELLGVCASRVGNFYPDNSKDAETVKKIREMMRTANDE